MQHFVTHRSKIVFVMAVLACTVGIGWAGNPHFVELGLICTEDTVCVSGKEAGLGNELQVHIEVTADAACINPGTRRPKAANKESFATGGDFPVQNGKAEFGGDDLCLTATFQPDCSPPMTVVFTNIEVCDTTNDICRRLSCE